MRYKVMPREYPRGTTYYVAVDESSRQIASTFKDDTQAAVIVDALNFVQRLTETGLYLRVHKRLEEVEKMMEEQRKNIGL